MNLLIFITTYNRPQGLLNLLHDIEKNRANHNLHLLIIDDCSTENYWEAKMFLSNNFAYTFMQSTENGGKENYYKLINYGYEEIKIIDFNFDFVLQIPDDVRLTDNFFDNVIEDFNSINDKRKVCLNIFNDYSRFGKSLWTGKSIVKVNFNDKQYHRTGWIDMLYIANRKFFEILNYKINRVDRMYIENKELSSGVGCQISKRIIEANYYFYQVIKSRVIHDIHESVMHPEHRKKNLLISNHENVTATMATMPGREESLKETVNSIIDQVDQLHIYCNEFDIIPKFLNHKKIKIYDSRNEIGDIGDAGKFYKTEKIKGYHISIDDDIIYPSNYVKELVEAIELNNRQMIVSFHGRKFEKKPVKSYYHSAEIQISCLKSLLNDTIVDVPGTGVMAYHTDTIKFTISDFKASNMADVWVGKKAFEKNVKILAVRHLGGWLKESHKINIADSIYHRCHSNDSIQTEVVNSFI